VIAVVAYDDEARSVTVGVDGRRYEYGLGDAYHVARAELHKLRRAPGRQLNWLKRRGRLMGKWGTNGEANVLG
jgi:hypothetical protein